MHPFLHIPHQDRAVIMENKKEGRQNPCMEREQERRERQDHGRERRPERLETEEHGSEREKQESRLEGEVGAGGEGKKLVRKHRFLLRKSKFLTMFLATTEAGKFSVSLRKGTLEEAGVEESQENGRKWFSFRILVGNR